MGRFDISLYFGVVLLALSIQAGESIKCYTCNSQQNSKCADPIDKSEVHTMECTKTLIDEAASSIKKGVDSLGNILGFKGVPEGANMDVKLACQKIDITNSDGKKDTYRSCTVAKSESVDPCAMTDYVSKLTNGKGKVDFCETCETELCNGSSHHYISIMFVLVVPCIATIISRWIGV